MNNDPFLPLALKLPSLDLGKLEAYACEIHRWNASIRLVGPRDLGGVRLQVADSLYPFLSFNPGFPLLDIGSGPGLPGIPLAIAFPNALEIVCVEPRLKRISFLRHAARTLGLQNVRIINGRISDVERDFPELLGSFETATARAVSDVVTLLGWAAPFLSKDGRVFLPRGEDAAPDVPGWRKLIDSKYDFISDMGCRRLAVYGGAGKFNKK